MAFINIPSGYVTSQAGLYGAGQWKNDPDAGECSQFHQVLRLKCFNALLGFASSNKPASIARSEAEARELLVRLS